MHAMLMTPAEREKAICQLEDEKVAFHGAYEWKPCFDDDARALERRRQLSNLIGALDERIAELRVRRGTA